MKSNLGRLGLAIGVATTLVFVGCGDQAQPGGGVAGGALDRELLSAMPRPDLGNFSEVAREQLQAELTALDDALGAESGCDDLTDRFGRIARIYHAYGLLDAAEIAYGNAAACDPSDFRWPYLSGVIDASRGVVESAEQHLELALELAPDDAPVALRLGELRLAQNRWIDAEPLFERLYAAELETEMALYGLARVAAAAEDHELAVEHYEALLEKAPEATALNYLLGLSYRKLGETARAEELIAQRGSAQLSYEDPLVDSLRDLVSGVGTPIERALSAFGEKDYEAAIGFYSEALEIEPGHATALRGRALSHREADDIASASVDFERLLELYPDNELVRLDYGTALLDAGEVQRSIDQLTEASRRNPEFKEAFYNLGVALTHAEAWQRAADAFGEAVRLDPRNVAARYYQGLSLDEAGDGPAAIAALRGALEEAPDHVAAQQRLALVQARIEGPSSAAATLQGLIDRESTPKPEKGLAYFQLGRLAKEREDREAAEAHYRNSIRLFPDLWQARFNLANLLVETGAVEEAAVELASALSRDPKNVVVRVRESELLGMLGEHGIARARLEEGLEEVPNSAELAHAFARLLASAPQASVRDGERALTYARGAFQAAQTVEHSETVAMALAELGRFDEAIEWQERTRAQAQAAGDRSAVDRLNRGLERLRKGQPIRDES